MTMYKHKLIFEDNAFQLGMTVPVNTSATATKALRVGRIQGNLAVTITAADGNVALATGTTVTLSLLGSETEGGSFVALAPVVPSAVLTTSGAYAPEMGDRVMSLIVPEDCPKWIKAVVTTDDVAAAGKFNVFLEYLAG
jgi:hypothetical protein